MEAAWLRARRLASSRPAEPTKLFGGLSLLNVAYSAADLVATLSTVDAIEGPLLDRPPDQMEASTSPLPVEADMTGSTWSTHAPVASWRAGAVDLDLREASISRIRTVATTPMVIQRNPVPRRREGRPASVISALRYLP